MRCLSAPRLQIHIDAGRGSRPLTAESGSARGFFLLKADLLLSLSAGAARWGNVFVFFFKFFFLAFFMALLIDQLRI